MNKIKTISIMLVSIFLLSSLVGIASAEPWIKEITMPSTMKSGTIASVSAKVVDSITMKPLSGYLVTWEKPENIQYPGRYKLLSCTTNWFGTCSTIYQASVVDVNTTVPIKAAVHFSGTYRLQFRNVNVTTDWPYSCS